MSVYKIERVGFSSDNLFSDPPIRGKVRVRRWSPGGKGKVVFKTTYSGHLGEAAAYDAARDWCAQQGCEQIVEEDDLYNGYAPLHLEKWLDVWATSAEKAAIREKARRGPNS